MSRDGSLTLAVLLALGVSLTGCAKRDSVARDLDANTADLRQPADSVALAPDQAGPQRDTQAPAPDSPASPAGSLRFGVLTDIHGATTKLGQLVDALVAAGASFLVVLGDIDSSADGLASSLTRVASSKLPVYVIAGNIESRPMYQQALAEVVAKHPEVSDLSPHGGFTRGGVSFVALAGYHLTKWLPTDGFLYGAAELAAVEGLIKASAAAGAGTTVLLTHGPPKSAGNHGIDYVPGAGNVGDPALVELIKCNQVPFAICGHIHEAGQRAVDEDDQPVPAGALAPRLRLNAGAVTAGAASLVELVGVQMRFTTIK